MIYVCAACNQLVVLQWLNELNPLALKVRRFDGKTMMHIAAMYGYQQILKELLSICKSLLKAKDLDGKTALHKAVWGSPKPKIVNLLLGHGADPNAKNHYGYTPPSLGS